MAPLGLQDAEDQGRDQRAQANDPWTTTPPLPGGDPPERQSRRRPAYRDGISRRRARTPYRDPVRYGVSLPNFGVGVDAALLARWARDAEGAGWDGFFLW